MLNDPNPRRNIRVLVADGSHIHSHLLADALMRDPLLEAIPFDSDSRSLVRAVTGLDIDVLVISAVVDEQPARGLELLRELRAVRPGIHAVVLLDSLKDDAVLNAFRAGARGILARASPLMCSANVCAESTKGRYGPTAMNWHSRLKHWRMRLRFARSMRVAWACFPSGSCRWFAAWLRG